MSLTVYLSGPITGKSFGDAQDWRERAAEELRIAGFRVLDPLRGKSWLSHQKGPLDSHRYDTKRNPTLSDKALMRRDKLDVLSADVVLCNFTEPNEVMVRDVLKRAGLEKKQIDRLPASVAEVTVELPSVGSVFEVAWGEDHNKLIVAVIPDDKRSHDHAFIRESAVIFNDLGDALRYVISCGTEQIRRD